MTLIIGWIGFSVATGLFASVRRGRNGIGWFFLALLISPLIAFVLLLILLPLEPKPVLPSGVIEHQSDDGISDRVAMVGLFALGVFVLLLIGGVVISSKAKAQQQSPSQQIFRNELGRTTGTATRSGNMTTFRDSLGNVVGTGTLDSSGTSVFRDGRGRTLGTITDSGRNATGGSR